MSADGFFENSPDYALDPALADQRRLAHQRRGAWAPAVKALRLILTALAVVLAAKMIIGQISRVGAQVASLTGSGATPSPSLDLMADVVAPLLGIGMLMVPASLLRAMGRSLDGPERAPREGCILLGTERGTSDKAMDIVRRARRGALDARRHLAALNDPELAERISSDLWALDEAVWAMARAAQTSGDPEVLAALEVRADIVGAAAAKLQATRSTMEAAAARASHEQAEEAAAWARGQAVTILSSADDLLLAAEEGLAAVAVAREQTVGDPLGAVALASSPRGVLVREALAVTEGEHGTRRAYMGRNCRCPQCAAAMRTRRQRVVAAKADGPSA